MRLTKKNITFYLLDKGFLNPKAFLSGDYILTQSMSRNSIFKIQHQNSTGVFVKQLINQDVTNSYLMQKDATSHYLIHESGLYKETSSYIPKYYGYDPNHHILVTEFFVDTGNIHEETFAKKELSQHYAKQMAKILSSYHFDITKEVDHQSSLQFFGGQIPWILNLGNIGDTDSNGMNNVVLQEIRKHKQLSQKIDKVASTWEITSLIHGDIKWMNFIVMPDKKDVKLIDWEIADLGDPLWDVAGVFQSYLSSWVMSFDNSNNYQHVKMQGTEFLTLETIGPVIKIFWDEYAKLQKFTSSEKKKALLKTLAYMSVRMIQTAFESNMSNGTLLPNSARVIQFCDHILNDTEKIAYEWNLID